MNRLFNLVRQVQYLLQHSRRWFVRETKREIILPVSVRLAQRHLQTAFATTITISKGFLASRHKYVGRVYNGEVDVQFTVRGKDLMPYRYSMHGQLFQEQMGSRLVMIVKVKTPVLFLLADLAVSLALISIISHRHDVRIILAILLPLLSIFVMAWHRSSAAEKISTLINKIISKQL